MRNERNRESGEGNVLECMFIYSRISRCHVHSIESPPDEFYEVTVEDLNAQLRDLKALM